MRNNALHILLIFVFAAFFVSHCEAQQTIRKNPYEMQSDMPYFETYLQDIPSSQINDILEDKEGFIWAATQNGVVRFDGIGHSLYGEQEGTKSINGVVYQRLYESYSTNKILALRKDEGLLTIDNDTKKSEFVHFKDINGDVSRLKSLVRTNIVLYQDTVLLYLSLFPNVLNQIDIRTGKIFASDTIHGTRQPHLVTRLVETKNGQYAVVNGVLFRIVNNDGHLGVEPTEYVVESPIVNVFDMSNGNLVILTRDVENHCNLFTGYDHETKQPIFQFSLEGNTRDIVDMDDGIWIGTHSGLFFYSYKSKLVSRYTAQNSKLPNPHITAMAKSKKQPIIWVGTNDGLVKNDYYSTKFSYYDVYDWSEVIEGNVLKVIKDDDEGYWLSISNDLYYKERGSSKFKKETFNGLLTDTRRVDPLYHSYSDRTYAVSYKTLYEYDHKTKTSRVVYRGESFIRSQGFQTFGKDLIWSETDNIVFFDVDRRKYHRKKVSGSGDHTKGSVTTLCADGDSIVWLIKDRLSLVEYNVTNDVFIWHNNFADNIGDKDNFKDMQVVYRNGQRELWLIATNGLYYYLPDKAKLQKIEYSPFFSRSVQTLFVDKHNNVWLGSEYGLACINNTDGRTYEYSNQSYKIPRRIQNSGISECTDGSIIVTGDQGFVEFSPDNFATNDYYPEPKVVQYQYMDAQSITTDSLTRYWVDMADDSILVVPKKIRSVKLATRVLNYSKSENNVVEWRREGDLSWRTINTTVPIILSSLSPGMNVIELRSSPLYNKENIVATVRKFYVYNEVRFFEEDWFVFVVSTFVLAFFVTLWFIRSRMHKLQQLKLETEIAKQTEELDFACARLKIAQDRVEKQNKELRVLTEDLENQVKERTSELEKEKAKIEETSKLKSAFLANLSHEVRTPMNCIVGFSKLLNDPTCTKEECSEFAHLIRESANSLLTLLGDLLDVSRIETGQMRVNLTRFPVLKDLQDIYKMLEIERKKASVEFLLNVSSAVSDVVIYSDRDRFKQILINLVYNAFKFTENGHVAITAAVVERADLRQFDFPKTFSLPDVKRVLLLSVEDTGIGMPADKIDVIFEPFRKLNNNKTLYPGLGLGLNICKNLIQILGGQIWVKSTLNFGSTFLFYFPIDDDEG